MPDQGRGQRAHAVEGPVQGDGRDDAAAAPAQPGEDEARRSGRQDRADDSGHHPEHPAAQDPGEPDVTAGQSQRGGDVPQAEQQRPGGSDTAEAPGPVQGSVQHPRNASSSGITVCNGMMIIEATTAPEIVE